uniref:hypothetical protein n=1 Tax=Lewinella sp. TaxID=2004506 RepID=UPI003D6C4912
NSEIRYTDEAGVTSVLDLATIDAFGASTVDQTISGHRIARHLASNGTSSVINETITDIALSGTTLSYDREDGTTTDVDLSGIGGGGGGSFGAVTVNVGPSTTHVHTGEDHYFIEANMLTTGNEIIIDESEPDGSVIEVWLTRSAGDVSFANTSIRTGNDAFQTSVSGVQGDSIRFIKIRGIWAAVYKGQY